jgi:hypothetical protein
MRFLQQFVYKLPLYFCYIEQLSKVVDVVESLFLGVSTYFYTSGAGGQYILSQTFPEGKSKAENAFAKVLKTPPGAASDTGKESKKSSQIPRNARWHKLNG